MAQDNPQILFAGHSWVKYFAEAQDIAAENGFQFESHSWPNANLETVLQNICRFNLIKPYHKNLLIFCLIPETWRYETLENVAPLYEQLGVPINPPQILMPNPDFDISCFVDTFTKFREYCLQHYPYLNVLLMTPPRIDVYQFNLNLVSQFPPPVQEVFHANSNYSSSKMAEYSRSIYAKINELCNFKHGWPEKSIFRNQIPAQKVKWCRKIFTKFMRQDIDTCGDKGPLVDGLHPTRDLIEIFWKQIGGWLVLDKRLGNLNQYTNNCQSNTMQENFNIQSNSEQTYEYDSSMGNPNANWEQGPIQQTYEYEPSVGNEYTNWEQGPIQQTYEYEPSVRNQDSNWEQGPMQHTYDYNPSVTNQNVNWKQEPIQQTFENPPTSVNQNVNLREGQIQKTCENLDSSANEIANFGEGPMQTLVLGDSWVKSISDQKNFAVEYGFDIDCHWWTDVKFEVIMRNIDQYLKPYHKFLMISCITPEAWRYETLESLTVSHLQNQEAGYVAAGFQPGENKVLMPNHSFSISDFLKKFNDLRYYCFQKSPGTHVLLLVPTMIDAYQFNLDLISKYPKSQQEIFHNNPRYVAQSMAEYARNLYDKLFLMCRGWPVNCFFRCQTAAERLEETRSNFYHFRKGRMNTYTCGKDSPLVDGVHPSTEVLRLFWDRLKYWLETGNIVTLQEALPDGQASRVIMVGDDTVKGLSIGSQSGITLTSVNYLSFGNFDQLIKLADTHLSDKVDVLFLSPFNWEFLYLANYVPYEEEPQVPLINECVEIDKLIEGVKMATQNWKERFPRCKVIWALPYPINFQKHYEWKVTEYGMSWNPTPEMNYEILYMTKAFYSLILKIEEEWKHSIPEIPFIDLRQCFFADEPDLERTFCDNNNPVFPSKCLDKNGIDPSDSLRQWFKMGLIDKIEETEKAVELALLRERRKKQRKFQKNKRYLRKKEAMEAMAGAKNNSEDANNDNEEAKSDNEEVVIDLDKLLDVGENLSEMGMECMLSRVNIDSSKMSKKTGDGAQDSSQDELSKLISQYDKKKKQRKMKLKANQKAKKVKEAEQSLNEIRSAAKAEVYLIYPEGEPQRIAEEPDIPKLMDLPLAPPGYMTSLSLPQDLLVTGSMLDTLGDTLPYLKVKSSKDVEKNEELKQELSVFTKLAREEFSEVSPFRILDIKESAYSHKFSLFFQRSLWDDLFLTGRSEVAMDAVLSAIKSMLMLKCEKGVKVVMVTQSKSFVKRVQKYLKPLVEKNFIGINDDIPLGTPVALINSPSNLNRTLSQSKLWDLSDVSAVIIFGDDLIHDIFSPATIELKSLIKLIYSNVRAERVNKVIISETGNRVYEHVASQLLRTKFLTKLEMERPPPKDESLSLFELLAAELEKDKLAKGGGKLKKPQNKSTKKDRFQNKKAMRGSRDSSHRRNKSRMDVSQSMMPADLVLVLNEIGLEDDGFNLFLANLGPAIVNEFMEEYRRIKTSHDLQYQSFLDIPVYHLQYEEERQQFMDSYKCKFEENCDPLEMERALTDHWEKYIADTKVVEFKNKMNRLQDEFKVKYSYCGLSAINSSLTPDKNIHNSSKGYRKNISSLKDSTNAKGRLAANSLFNSEMAESQSQQNVSSIPNEITSTLYSKKGSHVSRTNYVGKIKFSIPSKENVILPEDISKNAYHPSKERNKSIFSAGKKNMPSRLESEGLYSESKLKNLLLKEYPKPRKEPVPIVHHSSKQQQDQIPVTDLLKSSAKKPSFGDLLKMLGTSDRIEELMDVVSSGNKLDNAKVAAIVRKPILEDTISMEKESQSNIRDKKRSLSPDRLEKLESNPGMQEYLRESRQRSYNKFKNERAETADSSKKFKFDYNHGKSYGGEQEKSKPSIIKPIKIDVRNRKVFSKPVNNSFQKEKELVLLDSTLSLLEPVCDILGMIGPSLKLIITQAKSCLPDYEQAFKIFTEDESISLVNFSINKMKSLSIGADAHKYRYVIKQATDLLEHATTYRKVSSGKVGISRSIIEAPKNYPVDVALIAKATSGKDSAHTYQFIKNTFVYKGLAEPSTRELEEIFKAVSQIHFSMAYDK